MLSRPNRCTSGYLDPQTGQLCRRLTFAQPCYRCQEEDKRRREDIVREQRTKDAVRQPPTPSESPGAARRPPQQPPTPWESPSAFRRRLRMPSLAAAIFALAAGALLGPMIIYPLLPDAAADKVIELQQWVGGMLG